MADIKVPPPPRKVKEAPPSREQTHNNLDKPLVSDKENLNFKVSANFKREIKTYAASQGITLIDLLEEGFRLVKEKRGV